MRYRMAVWVKGEKWSDHSCVQERAYVHMGQECVCLTFSPFSSGIPFLRGLEISHLRIVACQDTSTIPVPRRWFQNNMDSLISSRIDNRSASPKKHSGWRKQGVRPGWIDSVCLRSLRRVMAVGHIWHNTFNQFGQRSECQHGWGWISVPNHVKLLKHVDAKGWRSKREACRRDKGPCQTIWLLWPGHRCAREDPHFCATHGPLGAYHGDCFADEISIDFAPSIAEC